METVFDAWTLDRLRTMAAERQSAVTVRETLEAVGWRFRMIGDRLGVQRIDKYRRLATPTDLVRLKPLIPAIRLSLGW